MTYLKFFSHLTLVSALVLGSFQSRGATVDPTVSPMVSFIKEVNIQDIGLSYKNLNCPANALCSPQAMVTAEFTIEGCNSSLGPISSYVVRDKEKDTWTIYLAATQIQDAPKDGESCESQKVVKTFAVARTYLVKEKTSVIVLK